MGPVKGLSLCQSLARIWLAKKQRRPAGANLALFQDFCRRPLASQPYSGSSHNPRLYLPNPNDSQNPNRSSDRFHGASFFSSPLTPLLPPLRLDLIYSLTHKHGRKQKKILIFLSCPTRPRIKCDSRHREGKSSWVGSSCDRQCCFRL